MNGEKKPRPRFAPSAQVHYGLSSKEKSHTKKNLHFFLLKCGDNPKTRCIKTLKENQCRKIKFPHHVKSKSSFAIYPSALLAFLIICHVFTYRRKTKVSQSHKVMPYGFSMKLFPAGSSRMKVKGESPVAQALSFNRNLSIASAV